LTDVRLGEGFCYLAVLLDLFSHRIVGRNPSESLEAPGALGAPEMALAARQPAAGWIHHSDRSSQYACREYVQRLKQAGARIILTEVGEPKENAFGRAGSRHQAVEARSHDANVHPGATPSQPEANIRTLTVQR
jgi:transposase InsO family protein